MLSTPLPMLSMKMGWWRHEIPASRRSRTRGFTSGSALPPLHANSSAKVELQKPASLLRLRRDRNLQFLHSSTGKFSFWAKRAVKIEKEKQRFLFGGFFSC